jgi:hypothetical protein
MKFAKIMRTSKSCLFLPFAFFLSFTFWHQKLNGQQDCELWPLQTKRVNFNLKMKIDRSSRYHFKILGIFEIMDKQTALNYSVIHPLLFMMTCDDNNFVPLATYSNTQANTTQHHTLHTLTPHTHIIIHVNTFCWSWCCDDDSDVFDD